MPRCGLVSRMSQVSTKRNPARRDRVCRYTMRTIIHYRASLPFLAEPQQCCDTSPGKGGTSDEGGPLSGVIPILPPERIRCLCL